MWISIFLQILIGLCGGITVAGATFALITTVNIVPRLAHVTKTSSYVTMYESIILVGGVLGSLLTTSPLAFVLPELVVILFGLASGMFVGALAITLAEALDVTTIFARRMRLHTGIPWIILSVAIGKVLGSLLFFARAYYIE